MPWTRWENNRREAFYATVVVGAGGEKTLEVPPGHRGIVAIFPEATATAEVLACVIPGGTRYVQLKQSAVKALVEFPPCSAIKLSSVTAGATADVLVWRDIPNA